jgi:hypothetical protein
MINKLYISTRGKLSKDLQFSDEVYTYLVVGIRVIYLRGEPEAGFKLKKE